MTDLSKFEISEDQSEQTGVDTGGQEWPPVLYLRQKVTGVGSLATRFLRLDGIATKCSYINDALYQSSKNCAKVRESLNKTKK